MPLLYSKDYSETDSLSISYLNIGLCYVWIVVHKLTAISSNCITKIYQNEFFHIYLKIRN
jgi:hypothetical protein